MSSNVEIVSYSVIGTEVLLVVLLCFHRTRTLGFIGTIVLMMITAIYTGYVLLVVENPPCTCIGIFENSSWKENVGYTVLCIALGLAAYIVHTMQQQEHEK